MPRSKRTSKRTRYGNSVSASKSASKQKDALRQAEAAMNQDAQKVASKTNNDIAFNGSASAAVIAKNFKVPQQYDEAILKNEIEAKSTCLNMLAFTGPTSEIYTATYGAVDKILPKAIEQGISLDERVPVIESVAFSTILCNIFTDLKRKAQTSTDSETGELNYFINVEDVLDYIEDKYPIELKKPAGNTSAGYKTAKVLKDLFDLSAFLVPSGTATAGIIEKVSKDVNNKITIDANGTIGDIANKKVYNADSEILTYYASKTADFVKFKSGSGFATKFDVDTEIKNKFLAEAFAGLSAYFQSNQTIKFKSAYSGSTDGKFIKTTTAVVDGDSIVASGKSTKDLYFSGNSAVEHCTRMVKAILSPLFAHILSYSLNASIDSLYRSALISGETISSTAAIVLTESIVYPKLKAILEQYHVSGKTLDDQLAIQINYVKEVQDLFTAAMQAYDANTSQPSAITYQDNSIIQPTFLMSAEEKAKNQREFSKMAVKKPTGITIPKLGGTTNTIDKDDIAKAYARSAQVVNNIESLGNLRPQGLQFGRRKRSSKRSSHKKRHNSFGRKKRSSHKKRNSFGRKRRSSMKHHKRSSFGRRRSSHKKRHASFGRKKRSSHKKRHASFGRRKRSSYKKRHASFGRRRSSHKKRHASFGRKKRSSHKKRHASFGRKKRSSHKKRHASFGRKRRSSRKH